MAASRRAVAYMKEFRGRWWTNRRPVDGDDAAALEKLAALTTRQFHAGGAGIMHLARVAWALKAADTPYPAGLEDALSLAVRRDHSTLTTAKDVGEVLHALHETQTYEATILALRLMQVPVHVKTAVLVVQKCAKLRVYVPAVYNNVEALVLEGVAAAAREQIVGAAYYTTQKNVLHRITPYAIDVKLMAMLVHAFASVAHGSPGFYRAVCPLPVQCFAGRRAMHELRMLADGLGRVYVHVCGRAGGVGVPAVPAAPAPTAVAAAAAAAERDGAAAPSVAPPAARGPAPTRNQLFMASLKRLQAMGRSGEKVSPPPPAQQQRPQSENEPNRLPAGTHAAVAALDDMIPAQARAIEALVMQEATQHGRVEARGMFEMALLLDRMDHHPAAVFAAVPESYIAKRAETMGQGVSQLLQIAVVEYGGVVRRALRGGAGRNTAGADVEDAARHEFLLRLIGTLILRVLPYRHDHQPLVLREPHSAIRFMHAVIRFRRAVKADPTLACPDTRFAPRRHVAFWHSVSSRVSAVMAGSPHEHAVKKLCLRWDSMARRPHERGAERTSEKEQAPEGTPRAEVQVTANRRRARMQPGARGARAAKREAGGGGGDGERMLKKRAPGTTAHPEP